MDKVSIIVPVYNVEDCLSYCVDSLRQQTYKNIEIILVDDGSTDSSGEICDQYAQEDERIKVLHIDNGGQSRARNIGVQASSSDWIMFLDSDDYYEKVAVEYLVALRDKFNADMAATTGVEVRNYEEKDALDRVDLEGATVLNRETALEEMFYGNIVGTHPGGKLYKKEIVEKYPFPEGVIYEDLAIAYEHIATSGEIAVGFIHLYKYYRRPGSTVNAAYSTKLLDFYKAMDCNSRNVRGFVGYNYPTYGC